MTDNDIKIINNTIGRLLAMGEHNRRKRLKKLLKKSFDKDLCEIQRELAKHDISHELIEAAFSEQNQDWDELALQVYVKKFGLKLAKDWQKQQKHNHVLQYRGFSHAQTPSVYLSLRTHLSA
ncbi:MAG: hypothetical protein ACI9C4_002146 [Paraglaciecola sp.]|jgi:hypothetical protein